MSAATTPAPVGVSKEHITKTPGVCGGKACIAGTRIRVMDVVAYHELVGLTPAQILEVWDSPITLADVYAALAYALDHPDELAADARREQEIADKYRPTGQTKYTLARDMLTGG